MNRSILIVICDFLLLSLLTFSTDMNRMAEDDTQRSARVDVVTNEVVEPGKDMATLMKQALEDERKGHEQLQQQLASARSTAEQTQAQLAQREQENARLQQQVANTLTNLEGLNRQLQASTTQSEQTQQKLATTEAEAKQQADLAAAMRQQLDQLSKNNQQSQAEKDRLAHQLQLAEAERRAASDRANLMQQEVQATRAENAKLADGFKTLATNSTALTQEIRDNRPLAPNTIFTDFVSNRVQTAILAARANFLGIDSSKNRRTETILVSDGTNIYAICHVNDTPLTLWDPGTDWDGLTGTLAGHGATVAIRGLSFHQQDPRIVLIPVSATEARQLGCKIYAVSSDPYKFQDAVLIGADEGYYGECNFQIDLNTPQYVKLDRNLLKGLFGKFNPSRGDLVFSRKGEFLGIMANGTYCLMLRSFAPAATLAFAPDVRNQHTGSTLAQLYDYVFQLPPRLQ
ncbi:MAG: hypothetical protein JF609_02075 [Verrucomicrobia bacterium]|nr:hypothetical protein [Verrucomicrobiota bacterium]